VSRLVFLLEEYSMKALLEGLLPRFFPDLPFLCVPHEGRPDLEKSVPRKLRAWREPGVRFAVVLDNDGRDCEDVKDRLVATCAEAGRADSVVRIACQELEAWYLGEPEALAAAFGDDRLARIGGKPRLRESDAVPRPAAELERMIPVFQKVSGARRMAQALTRERNRSASFRVLLDGIERMAAELSDGGEQ